MSHLVLRFQAEGFSAIVCAMRHLQPDMPIHTFTYSDSSSENDEGCWANIVNKHVNAIEHPVLLDSSALHQILIGWFQLKVSHLVAPAFTLNFVFLRKLENQGLR